MGYNFPNTPSIGTVYEKWKWDGTTWLMTEHGESVPAAPFDALAYNGMQINGGFEISQELGSTGTTAADGYVCDGWKKWQAGTMVVWAGTAAGIVPGFPKVLYGGPQTAQPTLGANDNAGIYTVIEGYRWARMAWGTSSAKPVTIAFWSGHHRVGLYCFCISNHDGTRSYIATYTQNVADANEYKTITIPGDTTGTWFTGNGAAVAVNFVLACGTTYTAPAANTWYGAVYIAVSGQVNAVASTADVFRFSGVTILPGIYAPTAAQSPLIMRPYDQELMTCQRYWQGPTFGNVYTGWADVGSNVHYLTALPVTMRAVPTVTFSDVLYSNASGLTVYGTTIDTFGCFVMAVADGRVHSTFLYKLDARL